METPKKLHKKTIILIILICCITAVVFISAFIVSDINRKKEPEMISKSDLEKILNISDLSTLETAYNGVAAVTNPENPDKIDYYVSYESKVKTGIDFQILWGKIIK